ncbi:MAG: hypothetical protein ABW019_09705 [Chitinophagaceae bacterium]
MKGPLPFLHAMNDHHPDTGRQTPREVLPGFYKQYHLDEDGGNASPYVKMELGKRLFLYLPNSNARRRAVFKHDVHHLLTGYSSVFKGETEIAAWEIGSGCTRYPAAFILNLYGIMIGMLFSSAGVYRAFIRGRHTCNLYRDRFTDEQLLDMPLPVIRKYLLLDRPVPKAGLGDWLVFVLVLLAGTAYAALSLLLLPFVLLYTLYVMMKRRPT